MFYTDDLVETRNGKEENEVKMLRQKMVELGARPAAEIVQEIVSSVVAFTCGGEQKDDVTLVVVKRTT